MKKGILLLCLLPMAIMSQTPIDQRIVSPISKVKLFLTSGEMQHHQKIKIHKGRNKLIFSGISAYADPQSIQFTSDGSYHLLSLSTEMDFLAAEAFNPKISFLNDSLEELQSIHQVNEDELAALNAEVGVLKSNQKLSGDATKVTVAEIKDAADFYRKRHMEINKRMSELKKQQQKLTSTMDNVRFQLMELNYNENMRSNQVIILLDSETEAFINADLKYLVTDCGWAAAYDLSAKNATDIINLKYKAQIYNNTGNEWSNVDIVLSTADPRMSASQPELTPWYIDYYTASYAQSKGKYVIPENNNEQYRQQAISSINMANQRVYDNYMMQDEEQDLRLDEKAFGWSREGSRQLGNTPVAMKTIQIAELNTEFPIAHKFSCPSDAKPYTLDVKELNLQAHFTYVTIPKLDNSAFLIANIVNWQEYDLMPGPMNVYFGGNYVGISELDTRNISDTMALSLGRDAKVQVQRKLKKEMSTKKSLANYNKDTYLYDIIVKNNHQTPIEITIYDQVPFSRSSDITISVDELSNGKQNAETGEVAWQTKLEAGEMQTKSIGYTIKYPKTANIVVQRYRTISAPKF